MRSTTLWRLRHSIASGVSGVTASTPSAVGGPLLLSGCPPAARASLSRAWLVLELDEDMPGARGAVPAPGVSSSRFGRKWLAPALLLRAHLPIKVTAGGARALPVLLSAQQHVEQRLQSVSACALLAA